METEIREIFFNIFEMRNIEELFLGSASIPIGYFSVGFLCMEEMEDMRSQRSHTGTTTDVDHFPFCGVDMEFTIRTGYIYLVARLSGEDKGRTHAWIDIHPTVICSIPRWGSNPDSQHDDISFSRVIGHGVSPEQRLLVFHHQIPHPKFIPIAFVNISGVTQFRMRRDIHILKIHRNIGNVNLHIAT